MCPLPSELFLLPSVALSAPAESLSGDVAFTIGAVLLPGVALSAPTASLSGDVCVTIGAVFAIKRSIFRPRVERLLTHVFCVRSMASTYHKHVWARRSDVVYAEKNIGTRWKRMVMHGWRTRGGVCLACVRAYVCACACVCVSLSVSVSASV